jgi:hypothetical protein
MEWLVFLTWVIPPMPLYSSLYKTANNEGDIFLSGVGCRDEHFLHHPFHGRDGFGVFPLR